MTKAERSASKLGHIQPHCHSKARSPMANFLEWKSFSFVITSEKTGGSVAEWLGRRVSGGLLFIHLFIFLFIYRYIFFNLTSVWSEVKAIACSENTFSLTGNKY